MKNSTVIVSYINNFHNENDLKLTADSVKKFSNVELIVVSNIDVKIKEQIIDKNLDNVWDAYNTGIEKAYTQYVQFFLPGDELLGLPILIDSQMYEFSHSRTNGKKVWTKSRLNDTTFHGKLPPNMKILCDKIFSLNIIKKNNLQFYDMHQAPFIFNLIFFDCVKECVCLQNVYVQHKVNVKTEPEHPFGSKKFLSKIKKITFNKSCVKREMEILNEEALLDTFYNHIDLVIPFVTMNDPEWLKQYKKYKYGNEWESGVERFRDSGMIKYVLRGTEKFMPWVQQVHLIVASESQVPSWINRENVDIILHEEFIPKKLLPTFNSTCIDMFLPNLPRVSDRFIYSNDDLITVNETDPRFFFNRSKPAYQINFTKTVKSAPGNKTRLNVYNLIFNTNQNSRILLTQHGPLSYRMSWIKECYKKYKKIFIESCSKFREEKNLNQYVYALWQMMNKDVSNELKNIKSYYLTNKNRIEEILKDDFTKYNFICINDGQMFNESWNKIIKKIDDILPNKSKYEI